MPDFNFTLPAFELPFPLEVLLGGALVGIGALIVLLWIRRRFKLRTAVKKLEKNRPKVYRGEAVLTFTKKHRKTGTNTYKKLKPKAKKRFMRYLGFKKRELRTVLKAMDKKAFGNPKSKLAIRVLKDKKEVKRLKWPLSFKTVIAMTDTHACLDECILFFDALPRQIANKRAFAYKPKTLDITFTYELE